MPLQKNFDTHRHPRFHGGTQAFPSPCHGLLNSRSAHPRNWNRIAGGLRRAQSFAKLRPSPPATSDRGKAMDSDQRTEGGFTVVPIGRVSSPLTDRERAPKQGSEGAPEAWLVFAPEFGEGLRDLRAGDEVLVLTWLDRSDRAVLSVHPRDDASAPLRGVFSTRSADRPNPIGIHRVRILAIEPPLRFRVSDLEAIDATPIIDVKPVLNARVER